MICKECNKSLEDCICIENIIDMKKSIEQAAEKYSELQEDVSDILKKYLVKAVFQDGAKSDAAKEYWFNKFKEQNNLYSQQDLVNILIKKHIKK